MLSMQTLQCHMLYCSGHIGMQDVLQSHSAEYGPPLHAELIIEEQVSYHQLEDTELRTFHKLL